MDLQALPLLQSKSAALCRNKHLVPVACAVQSLEQDAITCPEVVIALGGTCPSNRVLDCLERLAGIGALAEMPYPGRPQPRVFERVESPFWAFLTAWAYEADVKPRT